MASEVAAQRRTLMLAGLVALPVAVGVWCALYFLLPPIPGMDEPYDRLIHALNWCGIAVLLTFLTGINAVAHERLFTPAIDPLAGRETRRLRINARYLQHTLEQLALFVPALLLLSQYMADGHQMRAVVATAVVWMLARFAFWVGYHVSPSLRTPGLLGMALSIGVLLYVAARFGHDLAGPVGASVPLVLFAAIEIYLLWMSLRPAD